MMFSSRSAALFILLQAAPGDLLRALGVPVVLIVIFYLLLFAPARRKQKQTQVMLSALNTGDKVVTTSGLYVTIAALDGDTVQLRIADQVKVKMARSAVAGLQPESKED